MSVLSGHLSVPFEDAKLLKLASCWSPALFAASDCMQVDIPITRVLDAPIWEDCQLNAVPIRTESFPLATYTPTCNVGPGIRMLACRRRGVRGPFAFLSRGKTLRARCASVRRTDGCRRRKLSATVSFLPANLPEKVWCPTARHESFGMGDDVLISQKVAPFVFIRTFARRDSLASESGCRHPSPVLRCPTKQRR